MKLPRATRWSIAPLLSLLLLAGIWAEWRLFHVPARSANAYHARVRIAADLLPLRIGEWVGQDIDAPAAAISLLKPNVLRARRYRNLSTDEYATLILVHCRDARDMGGHYPPNCYPANGWVLRDRRPRALPTPRASIPGMVYRFAIESVDRFSEILVYNFFVRPDGGLDSGSEGAFKAAGDHHLKRFGAAQVQMLFGASMPPERRDEVFRQLVGGALPVIDAIRDGGGE